jgi:hypothetical protein
MMTPLRATMVRQECLGSRIFALCVTIGLTNFCEVTEIPFADYFRSKFGRTP